MYPSYGNFNNNMNYNQYTNPMQPQMDRLNMMQQQYTQQNQQQINQQPQQTIIPVAGIEEVRSHAVDWSGNATYFIDNVNKRIYTKQLNLSGVPEINTYVLNNEIVERKNNDIDNELNKRIENLEQRILNFENMILGGSANVQSTNVNTNDARREA